MNHHFYLEHLDGLDHISSIYPPYMSTIIFILRSWNPKNQTSNLVRIFGDGNIQIFQKTDLEMSYHLNIFKP